MDLVDLHLHSIYSDGMCSPKELVLMAKENDLKAISLTDHDTIDGIDEAVRHGKALGLEVIPGVELDACHEKTSMHLLGFFIDTTSSTLLAGLGEMQRIRRERNIKIVAKLKTLGIDLHYDELRRLAVGQLGRPHLARILVAKGVVKSGEQAFSRFLRDGAEAYVSKEHFPASEAIAMIRAAGGLAVLAHPGAMDASLKSLPPLLAQLKEFGLHGIEAYSSAHTKSLCAKIITLAKTFDLLVSGGSDYHGGGVKPHVSIVGPRMGAPVSATILESLRKALP